MSIIYFSAKGICFFRISQKERDATFLMQRLNKKLLQPECFSHSRIYNLAADYI
jgi:hypothetical protein